MFSPIGLYRLRNPEAIQFFIDLKSLILTGFGSTAVPEGVQTALDRLQAVTVQLDALFKTDPSSLLSDTLRELDEVRDDLLIGLRKWCDACSYHPNPAFRDAANTLLHNLKVYGPSPEKQPVATETKIISSLLEDWTTKPELAAAAQKIGTAEWTTALAAANTSYQTKSLERTGKEAAAAFDYNMRQKRTEADGAYKELLSQLSAHYIVAKGAAPWGDIAAAMGRHTEKQDEVLAMRKGRRAAAAKKEAKA
ncbi:MAG: hypothetical protein JWP69_1437 [Flaviaesturariibacter sp.]|nr:hypothetical protein [Flaviaesturariibacter sp.]